MPLIIIPLITVLINDFLKVVFHFLRTWKFKLSLMFRSWGMPSWHTSFVASAMTVVFLELWPWSIEFMMTATFAIIIMYDARWIRRKSWYHAEILNKILWEKKLDESLWHTNTEVFLWLMLSVLISFFLWKTGYFVIS
jgi:acid phosphatase family membrane protein YuiD